jgi:hypothetical protein
MIGRDAQRHLKEILIMVRSILTLSLFVSLSGCCMGGTTESTGSLSTTPSGTTASCDSSVNVSSCRDLSGNAFMLGEDFQRSLCLGTYTASVACPAAARVGSCDDGNGTVTRYYSTGNLPYTLEAAQSECMAITTNVFTAG